MARRLKLAYGTAHYPNRLINRKNGVMMQRFIDALITVAITTVIGLGGTYSLATYILEGRFW